MTGSQRVGNESVRFARLLLTPPLPSDHHDQEVTMPTIVSGPTLSVSATGTSATLTVKYSVTVSAFEVWLVSNGLVLEERIQIIGDDDGDATDKVLHTFQPERLPSTAGTHARTRTLTVTTSSLNEDDRLVPVKLGTSTLFQRMPDTDELVARVEAAYVGLEGTARAESPVVMFDAPTPAGYVLPTKP